MVHGSERIASRKHKTVYEIIRRQGTVSKIDLLEQSQMTGSTLTRILEELTAQGLILEAGFGESTGGRRPILYQINPTYGYVFGLEISRIYSRLVLCDLNLNKIDAKRWPMTESATPEYLLEDIVASIHHMLVEHNISADSILGLGIGAVGPLDRFSGTIVDPLYFPSPNWKNVRITAWLQEKLRFPVYLDNGANTAILAEYWSERNRDYQHLLYIHAGVGLRSAMISNGVIVYGAVDMEGAIGQMIIQTDGPRLSETGNFGSLESYASIYALERTAQSRLKQGRQSVLRKVESDPEKIHFSHLVLALLDEDPLAVELFTQAATYFGIGLANLLNILHPEKVILGGPLITSHPMFFEISTKVAIEKTYYSPVYQVEFSQGDFGEEALVIGAAIMVINKLTE